MKKVNKVTILSLIMALLMLGSLSVAAQDNMGNDKMNDKDMSKKDKMNSKMSENMDSKMMMSDDDKEFAKMASMGNAAEIKTARLALERSNNKDVKKFAKMIIKDHTKAGKELQKIAMQGNMAQPNALSEEQNEEYSKLQAATGADFDKMYIANAGLEDHQKTIDLFQKEADNGENADLKAFAAKTLPTLKGHLQAAQSLSNGSMMNDSMMNDSMDKSKMTKDSMKKDSDKMKKDSNKMKKDSDKMKTSSDSDN